MDSLRNSGVSRILVVFVVIVLAAGASLFYLRSRDSASSNQNSSNTNSRPATNAFDARQGTVTPDADSDGLSDARENELGTNPTLADTDRDELSDFDESEVYKSDPKKADTDGDGNNDGTEVKNGFSPTTSGRLFDTSSSAITNAQ